MSPSAAHRVAGGSDEGLHARPAARELPSPQGGEPILRAWPPAIESLRARHVAGVLELAGMDAQVAVRRLQQGLDLVEREPLRRRQRAHDAEPEAVVNEV